MNKTLRSVVRITLGLILAIVLFHFTIVFGLIPYENAWGGQLKTASAMYVFETISIVVNLFFAWIVLMKGHYMSFRFSTKTINIILSVFLILFLLNTLGNLLAKTNFERFFSIVTALLALLIWLMLRKPKN